MDQRDKQSEKTVTKKVIDAIREIAGGDPQEHIKILEDAIYGFADGFFAERERRRQAEKAVETIAGWLVDVEAEYNSSRHTRSDERARAVVRLLGLNQGKRKGSNKQKIYWEYLSLVHGELDSETLPVSKHEALKILAERHGFASGDSCLEQLRSYLREKTRIAKENEDEDEDEEIEGCKCIFDAIRKKSEKSPEQLQDHERNWEKLKKELKEEDWISKRYKGILPGRNPYK